MVAFNFQARFADAVEKGEKRQTIRAKARCTVGDKLQLYTGQRTRKCRKLADAVCTKVALVRIAHTLIVDMVLLCKADMEAFAKHDGFESWADMCAWFEKNGGLPFNGYLIQWELTDA